jgi:hypothetical protein
MIPSDFHYTVVFEDLNQGEKAMLLCHPKYYAGGGSDAFGDRDDLLDALRFAEAALADIGDAEREPGDDLQWCENRAAAALPRIRNLLNLHIGQKVFPNQTEPENNQESQMNEIEEVEAQIKVLEAKLSLLKEIERLKTPEERAYKEAYGKYPVTDISAGGWDVISWEAFQKGRESAKRLVQPEPSMINCIITGKPPGGCSLWAEWFEKYGSKGILNGLHLSARRPNSELNKLDF